MALINRITRLFKADFHAVLDQIEEPEALLKQAIRDMEDDLASTEQRIALCAHDQETLTVRKSELEEAVADFETKLDLCFESDKDDLAKNLIRKRLCAAIPPRFSISVAGSKRVSAHSRRHRISGRG